VDRLTRGRGRDAHLVLLPNDRPELDGALGTWKVGSSFCFVGLHPEDACTAEDSFACVVAVAAHERAHARWSTRAPSAQPAPEPDAPEAVVAAYERDLRCFDILEDMRIERLLDRVATAELTPYRLRAALAMSLGDDPGLPRGLSKRLLCVLHNVVTEIQCYGETAWDRAAALGRHAGLPATVLDEALDLLRAAAAAGEAQDVVPALAERLARLLEQLEGGAGE
jgi:hypothetical protein